MCVIKFSKRIQGLCLPPPWHLPWWPPLRSRRRPPWRAAPGIREKSRKKMWETIEKQWISCCLQMLILMFARFNMFLWSYTVALQIQTVKLLSEFYGDKGVSRNSLGTPHLDLMKPSFGSKIFTESSCPRLILRNGWEAGSCSLVKIVRIYAEGKGSVFRGI